MKSGINTKNIFDDKLNNNNVFNESLININNIIQKIIEENRKNKNKDNNKSEEENSYKNKDENNKIISTYKDNNFQPNVHIKNTTNIKGVYLNNIQSDTNSYDFNDYRDKNIYDIERNKNKETLIEKNLTEKKNVKKDNNKNNKVNKKELSSNKFSKTKITINKSRKNSRLKKENLSIKNYIKKTKTLFDDEKLNKENKSMKLSTEEIKDEVNHTNANELTSENIKPNILYMKNRSYTEKNLKNVNLFSSGNRKKTRNLIINNNNFFNSNIKRKSFHKNKKNNSKNKNNTKNTNTNNNIIYNKVNKIKPENKNNAENKTLELSKKEKSYFILSNSPILRLKERLLFGRSTPHLRNKQSIADILSKNQIFLKDKITELNEKISECDTKINIVFNPSKTAEINFNFILSKDEEDLKNFFLLSENEDDKKEYSIYIKMIYILFDENYENIELKKLNQNLYMCLNKKGFKNIKDYLYHIYFKNKEKINIISKINKINSLIGDTATLSQNNFQFKFGRFALFTSFLISEVIRYGINIKNFVDLKIKTKEFIDVIKQKIDLYNSRTGNINKTN